MPFPELFRDDVFRIETTRLWLRWPRAADARVLQQLAGVTTIAEQTEGWRRPISEADADWHVLRAREGNLEGRSLVLAITRKKAPDQIIGFIGAEEQTGRHRELDLWYLLDQQWLGRGLMTEAVSGLAGTVFMASRFGVIRASCDAFDPVARQVLADAGFAHTGAAITETPGDDSPEHVDEFALGRSAWLGLSAPRRC